MPSQYHIGCCTASASLVAAEMIMAMGGKNVPLSRLFVYYMTRKMQGRVGEKGTDLKSTLECMVRFGVSPELHWSFGYNKVDIEPSMQSKDEAAHYRLHSFDPVRANQFMESIDNNMPIVIGMFTGRMFWKMSGPLAEQAYKPVNLDDNRRSNGHAVTIIGYDDSINNGSWIVANSLGPKWGDHGFGAIPYSCTVDIGEAYVLNGFAGITPERKISDI